MRKWYSLIDKVYAEKNLQLAYEKVRRNRGSKTCGADGISLSDFSETLEENLYQIRRTLRDGTYKPSAVRRVYIDKPDGGKRPLGIPTITDRIVQQALLNLLEPIFDPHFHPSSYGYRPKRSAHHALAKAEAFSRKYGLEHVVDMDLSKCFDTLDHKLILRGVSRRVSDGKILQLIGLMLKSGILEGTMYEPTKRGSPQGGVISPLLMNIYLDEFDQHMKSKGIRIVRYADDILIFGRTKQEAGAYRAIATSYLENQLQLTVNSEKTHLTNLSSGISYLGFVIYEYGTRVSEKSVARLKERVRKLTPRSHGKSLTYYVSQLNKVLTGYSNYYRVGLSKKLFRNIMSWIRRRLRMMQMKEWKGWKALHKQLRRRGYKGSFDRIRMNCWRNSSCTLLHMALPNSWFDEELELFNMEKVTTNTLHQYYDQVLHKV
jgi:RNA-directed DNA polymerase